MTVTGGWWLETDGGDGRGAKLKRKDWEENWNSESLFKLILVQFMYEKREKDKVI